MKTVSELWAVPVLSAALPWPWAFRVMRRVFHHGAPWYRADAVRAWQAAHAAGFAPAADAAAADWQLRHRLTLWADQVDLALARTRSNHFFKHLRVRGTWPEPGTPALLCTFHWGCGMWAHRHLAASGLKVHALVAPLERSFFTHDPLRYHYYRLRNETMTQALGRATVDARQDVRRVLQAFDANEQVFVAIDVPADQVQATVEIPFLGRQARVPSALFKLALRRQIPIYSFTTGIDMETGQRELDIRPVLDTTSVEHLACAVFSHLEQAIAQDPAAWHFWGEQQRFFVS